jgi:hypothetical protein
MLLKVLLEVKPLVTKLAGEKFLLKVFFIVAF